MTEIQKVESWLARKVIVNDSLKKRCLYFMSERNARIIGENTNEIAACRKWLADQKVKQFVNNL